MSDLITFISEAGFPVVVTLILLFRIEGKLDQIVQSIDRLPERIGKI